MRRKGKRKIGMDWMGGGMDGWVSSVEVKD